MKIEKYLRLRYIYILAIIFCVYLTYMFRIDMPFDTQTYINAWITLQEGQIDKWRTPVYPLFLGLMRTVFGDIYLYCVVIIQHLLFLVSIRYFYLLVHNVINNKKILFFMTFFYALYPCGITYNCCIITETFALTGSVFLLYSILSLYRLRKTRFAFYAFFWLFFLTFLRPAIVYLVPVTIVGWSIIVFNERCFLDKSIVYGLAGSTLVGVCLLLYIVQYKNTYGVYTPSGIGLINKYTIAKGAHLIDLNTRGEKLGFYQEAEFYINKLGMETFSDSVSQSVNRNKSKYLLRLLRNARKASEDKLFEPSRPIGVIEAISDTMGIRLKIIYFLFFVYVLLLCRWIIVYKEIPFFSCLLFMIGVSNYIVMIIGSPGEYGRLSLPAIPAYLIMFGQMLNIIKVDGASKVKYV